MRQARSSWAPGQPQETLSGDRRLRQNTGESTLRRPHDIGLSSSECLNHKDKSTGANEILQKLGKSLGSTATVKSVFGDPVHVEGKTVVAVARVVFWDLGRVLGLGQGHTICRRMGTLREVAAG